MWEIAVLLGEGITVEEKEPQSPATTFRQRNIELIKQRMAHEAGLGPKPEARPMNPAAMAVFGQI